MRATMTFKPLMEPESLSTETSHRARYPAASPRSLHIALPRLDRHSATFRIIGFEIRPLLLLSSAGISILGSPVEELTPLFFKSLAFPELLLLSPPTPHDIPTAHASRARAATTRSFARQLHTVLILHQSTRRGLDATNQDAASLLPPRPRVNSQSTFAGAIATSILRLVQEMGVARLQGSRARRYATWGTAGEEGQDEGRRSLTLAIFPRLNGEGGEAQDEGRRSLTLAIFSICRLFG